MKNRDSRRAFYIGNKAWAVHKRSMIAVVIAMIILLITRIVPDAFFEKWYYNGFFQGIRIAYDNVLGWSPIPMVYFVLVIIIVRTALWVNDRHLSFSYQASRAIGGIAWLIIFFYVFWGFNYQQRSLQDRLGYDLADVTKQDMEIEFERATNVLKSEAQQLPTEFTNDQAIMKLAVTDNHLRADVEKALAALRVPNTGRVRVRQLWPNGFLLRWSTAGIYIPHAFEGHIDKGLLSVQKPFTIAHEMAHGYGITDEGACNFIAWLACTHSQDPWVRFGGALTYWRYTAGEMESQRVKEVMDTFEPVISRSIQLIRENDRRFPDLMPQIRDAIYSSYLKRHGVKGGLRSYNYVVMMVDQYFKKQKPSIGTE